MNAARYGAVIVGTGPAGEVAASRLNARQDIQPHATAIPRVVFSEPETRPSD